jgi:hypothetical protein
MKKKLLFLLLISFAVVGYSSAQLSSVIKGLKPVNQSVIQAKAMQLLQSAGALADTITIEGGDANAGLMETTINGDVTGLVRTNPNRVYKLKKNQIYIQQAAIDIKNPTGKLTIVGEKGGVKPVVILQGVNGVNPGSNLVQGSIKLDNLQWENKMVNDNTTNVNLFIGSTDVVAKLPQSVEVNNCLIEFTELDLFSCDAYTFGAKFKFTNNYFRNLFWSSQWWGGRVMYCKQYIDTLIVDNNTVSGGGLSWLQQHAVCKYAMYNHNTVVLNDKYWNMSVYYIEAYFTNNLFIVQNWVGEDRYNVATGGQDPDPGMFMGTIGVDTLEHRAVVAGVVKYTHPTIQQEFMNADSTLNASKTDLNHIKIFVSNNVQWQDTVLLNPYYKNVGGAYGGVFTDCPSSYLTWTSPYAGPYRVENIPGKWMNERTLAIFAAHSTNIKESHNHVNVEVTTVTPVIKDASVVLEMGHWNQVQWGQTGVPANTIDASAYFFGDNDAVTIPGLDGSGNKTEDGSGIRKFTDMIDNFSQTGTKILSTIDGLEVGSQIWDDTKYAAYNAATSQAAVKAAYLGTDVKQIGTVIPEKYSVSQNYPNPFNPTTTINFSIPKTENVKLIVYNMLGQQVRTLVNEVVNAGNQSATWDGKDSRGFSVSSGIYFYQLTSGSFTATHKMILMK